MENIKAILRMILLHYWLQAHRTLFHIKGATFFKKGQLQGGLKQLNLEQNPC